LFYGLWDVKFSWYIPDLQLGFKYYLDLLQMVPTRFVALVLLFLAIAAQRVRAGLHMAAITTTKGHRAQNRCPYIISCDLQNTHVQSAQGIQMTKSPSL
jgi:hypothetical protein